MHLSVFLSMMVIGAISADPSVETITFARLDSGVIVASMKNESMFNNLLEPKKPASTLKALFTSLGREAQVSLVDRILDMDILRIDLADAKTPFPFRRIDVGNWEGETYCLTIWKDPELDVTKEELIAVVNWLNTSFNVGLDPQTASVGLKVEKAGSHLITVNAKRQ